MNLSQATKPFQERHRKTAYIQRGSSKGTGRGVKVEGEATKGEEELLQAT